MLSGGIEVSISFSPPYAHSSPSGTLQRPTMTLSVSSWRNLAAAGAERRPDRHLARSTGGAREHQVRNVEAGNQQHHRDRPHHRQDDQLDVFGQRPLAHRLEIDPPALVAVGEGGGQVGRDGVAFLLRLSDRLSRRQPSEHHQPACAALLTDGEFRERQPQVLVLRELEAPRHDADHRVRPRIDLDAASDDGRIAVVAALPEIVGDQHDRLGAGAIVVRHEAASELR